MARERNRDHGSGRPLCVPLPAAVAGIYGCRDRDARAWHWLQSDDVQLDARGAVASAALSGTEPDRHHSSGRAQSSRHRRNHG